MKTAAERTHLVTQRADERRHPLEPRLSGLARRDVGVLRGRDVDERVGQPGDPRADVSVRRANVRGPSFDVLKKESGGEGAGQQDRQDRRPVVIR